MVYAMYVCLILFLLQVKHNTTSEVFGPFISLWVSIERSGPLPYKESRDIDPQVIYYDSLGVIISSLNFLSVIMYNIIHAYRLQVMCIILYLLPSVHNVRGVTRKGGNMFKNQRTLIL